MVFLLAWVGVVCSVEIVIGVRLTKFVEGAVGRFVSGYRPEVP